MPLGSHPAELPPIEIIDGQHRLYAFLDDEELEGDFELPVVLFEDLDISWQAYLFWTINITPTRINPSMAYDLYPLLRTVRWLELVEGPMAYRETRAQELTEALWGQPESPWHERIGMLGRERGKVTQAAFVRSLTLSFVRGWARESQDRDRRLLRNRAVRESNRRAPVDTGAASRLPDRALGWSGRRH